MNEEYKEYLDEISKEFSGVTLVDFLQAEFNLTAEEAILITAEWIKSKDN